MKIFEFERHFPDEESCRNKFRNLRLKQGVVCPKCGCTHHYWKSDKGMFQCKECGHRQSLRYGTVMQGSKLPFRYWFIAMHLLTATKHTFSAAELQRQLGHNRYQPIWEMVHKLRSVMGQRDSEYMLTYSVELDEGFFTVGTPRKEEKMRQGSKERKATVLVMAESVEDEKPKLNMKKKKVGHLKMLVIPDTKKSTITEKAVETIHKDALVSMDASHSHSDIEKKYKSDCRKSITQEYDTVERKVITARHLPRDKAGIPPGISQRVLLQVQQAVFRRGPFRPFIDGQRGVQDGVSAQVLQEKAKCVCA